MATMEQAVFHDQMLFENHFNSNRKGSSRLTKEERKAIAANRRSSRLNAKKLQAANPSYSGLF